MERLFDVGINHAPQAMTVTPMVKFILHTHTYRMGNAVLACWDFIPWCCMEPLEWFYLGFVCTVMPKVPATKDKQKKEVWNEKLVCLKGENMDTQIIRNEVSEKNCEERRK